MSILRHIGEGLLVIIALPLIAFAASDTASLKTTRPDTTFKVTSYIPVLFKDFIWTVGGGFDFSGNNRDRSENPSFYFDSQNTDYHYSAVSFNSNLQRRRLTIAKEETWNLQVYGTYNGSRSSSTEQNRPGYELSWENRTRKSDTYELQISPSGDELGYFYRNLFYEVTGAATVYFVNIPNEDQSSSFSDRYVSSDGTLISESGAGRTESNASQERLAIETELSAGWGRIYMGNYAATALYMIGELRDHALLTAEPDHQILDSLTEIIYQFRLRHAVDSRLLHIEALSAIADYLKSHGIIDNSGPVASLYLQDVWDYFPRYDRAFGFRSKLTLGVTRDWRWSVSGATDWSNSISIRSNPDSIGVPDTTSSSQTRVNTSRYTRDVYLRYFGASLEVQRPVNLRTQLSGSLIGRRYFNSGQRIGLDYTDYSSYYDLTSDLRMDYIINSRSRINVSSNLEYTSRNEVRWSDSFPAYTTPVTNYDLFSYRFSAGVVYRLNIPTSLSFEVSYSGDKSNFPASYDYSAGKFSEHNYSLFLSINHYLY